MAITRDEVFEAAEGLSTEGQDSTYITVRERLGSGSFSTISKYLREWKAAGKERSSGGEREEMPQEFQVTLSRFGAEVWRTLGAFARTEIEAAREAFEARARERDEELERAASTVDALQGELEDVSGERDELQRECQALRAAAAEKQGIIDELRGRLAEEKNALKVQSEEILRTKEERDGARAEVTASLRVEENLRRELQKEEARSREMSSQIKELSAKLTEEASRRAKAEERLSLLQGA